MLAERFLGYFRDPDVAFVVGPQVYGNYRGFVTRAAESQQFLFHSLLQRAGNRCGTPMLVGTNNAVRISRAESGGRPARLDHRGHGDEHRDPLRAQPRDRPSLELGLHARRGCRGRGTATFTDYFIQQSRWSLGGNRGRAATQFLARRADGSRRGGSFHYSLLMAFYPTTAITWTLVWLNGPDLPDPRGCGLTVSLRLWLMLYFDAAALQVRLYFWNRRHNVSPHEGQGSLGPGRDGHLDAVGADLRLLAGCGGCAAGAGFVVTPKGELGAVATACARSGATSSGPRRSSSRSRVAAVRGNTNPWMCVWSVLALLVCLAADRRSGAVGCGRRAPRSAARARSPATRRLGA